MREDFDVHYWNMNNYKLVVKFPQLTNADLIWRHESKHDLLQSIAEKLGIKLKDLEEITASL